MLLHSRGVNISEIQRSIKELLFLSRCVDPFDDINDNRYSTTLLSSNQLYCPSGFSELLPARKISSVDRRLTAMTELMLDADQNHCTREADRTLTKNEASVV